MSSNLEYKKSILLFRHGSRAPSGAAFDLFKQISGVQEDWRNEDGTFEIENLTEYGRKECYNLGKWARQHLKEKRSSLNTIDSVDKIKWRCSCVPRVQESGQNFLNGFIEGEQLSFEIVPKPYEAGADPNVPPADYSIRPWDVNNDYKKWEASLKVAPLFSEKAKESLTILNDIVDTLQLKGFDKFPKSVLLYGMTLARELIDCERYYAKAPKRTFATQLTKEQIAQIDELALWCWNVRFFQHEFVSALSEKLVGEITEEINHAGASDESVFSFYSVHDYTLLVLLAGLGIEKYPELLSFCAFILIDVFDQTNEDGTKKRVFTVSLNPNPFDSENVVKPAVQEQNMRLLKNKKGEDYWTVTELRQ